MIAVLLAIIAAQAVGLLVAVSLLGDMRHQRDLARAREAGLQSRLERQPQPRPLVRVYAVLPDKLPGQEQPAEPQRALPAGNDGGTIAFGPEWPEPPSAIDALARTADVPVVPDVPIGDDGDGSGAHPLVPGPAGEGVGVRESRDREARAGLGGSPRVSSRIPSNHVTHGPRRPDWLRWPAWLLAHWPGALEVLRG